MKKLLLLFIACSASLLVLAQDTVKRSNKQMDYKEEFSVLKSNKKLRHGAYTLTFGDKLVASGRYDQGKRSGVWNFYSEEIPVQQYDFTAKKILAALPVKEILTKVDTAGVRAVTNPAVIGGLTAGARFMASYLNYSSYLDAPGQAIIVHTVKIDADGKIIEWVTAVKTMTGIKRFQPSLNDIPDDIKLFVPAVADGKNVVSTISFIDAAKISTQSGVAGGARSSTSTPGTVKSVVITAGQVSSGASLQSLLNGTVKP